MNPHTPDAPTSSAPIGEAASFQLPPVPAERAGSRSKRSEKSDSTVSLAPDARVNRARSEAAAAVAASPERGGAARQAPPLAIPAVPGVAVPPPLVPAADPPQDDNDDTSAGSAAQLTGATKTSLINDSDLIEKAWVDKAKQIVEQTRDDPHKQSEELTIFKADYMKKHYDKTIKLAE